MRGPPLISFSQDALNTELRGTETRCSRINTSSAVSARLLCLTILVKLSFSLCASLLGFPFFILFFYTLTTHSLEHSQRLTLKHAPSFTVTHMIALLPSPAHLSALAHIRSLVAAEIIFTRSVTQLTRSPTHSQSLIHSCESAHSPTNQLTHSFTNTS